MILFIKMFIILIVILSLFAFALIAYNYKIRTYTNKNVSKNSGYNGSIHDFPYPICKFYVDNNFRAFEYNDSFLNLIGYTEKDFKEDVLSDFSKIIFIADYDVFKYQIFSQLTYNTRVNLNFKIVKRNGEFCWVILSGTLYRDEYDKEYILANFTDISSTKKIDENVKKLESRIMEKTYETLSAGALILTVDSDPSILFINKVGIMFLGYSYYQIKEKFQSKMSSFIYDDDKEMFRNILSKVSQFDEDYVESFNCRIVSKVGRIYWITCMAKLNIDEYGNRYCIIVFVDSTKSKSLETRLKMENNELQYIYKNVNIGTCIIYKDDNNFKISSINKFAISSLDYSGFVENDFVGANIEKIVYSEDLISLVESLKNVIKYGSEISLTFRCITKNGDIKWMSSIIKIYEADKSAKNVLMTLIDVTDIKLYEDNLLKSEVRYINSIENANIHVIDWNVVDDKLKLSPKSASILGMSLNSDNAYKKLLSIPLIYENDKQNIKNAINEIMLGSDFSQCRIRIMQNNEYKYYKIIFTNFLDHKKKPERAIGLLIYDSYDNPSKMDLLNYVEQSKFYKNIILMSEVNFATDKFIFGLDYARHLIRNNLTDSYQKFMDKLINTNIVHKSDQKEFLEKFDRRNLMTNYSDENKEFSMNVRLLQEDGSYRTFKYIVSLDKDIDMCPIGIICVLG